LAGLSWQNEEWKIIGREKYNKNYHYPKYSIILEHFTSDQLKKYFNEADNYILLKTIFDYTFPDSFWVSGATIYENMLEETFQKYFESNNYNQEIIEKAVNTLSEYVSRGGHYRSIKLNDFMLYLKKKYNVK
jgi:hypothetical protein